MSLVVNEHDPVRLTFSEVADLQIDGGLDVDEAYPGWALIETTMLVADGERDDERLVYVGALPDALICFASRPGLRR